MVQNAGDIRGGMEVYALDGQRLGTVDRVWLNATDLWSENKRVIESAAIEVHEPAAHRSAMTEVRAETSYFAVSREEGSLYVPFTAVQVLFPGESATLDCTMGECVGRYGQRPDFLEE